jgi:hypothetical protein
MREEPQWSTTVHESTFGWSVLYDVVHQVLIILVLVAILTAQIIDSFTAMREANDKIGKDLSSKCFVCGISANTFDTHGDGFRRHCKQDHNLWSYANFFIYLKEKEKTEFSGQEDFVYRAIQRNDLSLFPRGQAFCLRGTGALKSLD